MYSFPSGMWKFVYVILTLALLTVTFSCQLLNDKSIFRNHLNATVIRIIDGDTIEVRLENGMTDKVRLLGVDTPETNNQNKVNEYGTITDTECLQAWGKKATHYAVDHLIDKEVVLIRDEYAGARGYYDRLLAYVEVDNKDFNESLVELGYARVYEEGKSGREPEYLEHQENAQIKLIGLWSC